MDNWQKEVKEHIEKLKYLEDKKEENLEILKKRIEEIEEEQKKKSKDAST